MNYTNCFFDATSGFERGLEAAEKMLRLLDIISEPFQLISLVFLLYTKTNNYSMWSS
jgi:hypothetical protein